MLHPMPVNAEKTVRKMISFPRDLWERVADYRFENRINRESEAVAQLLEAGLAATAKPPPTSARSKPAGAVKGR